MLTIQNLAHRARNTIAMPDHMHACHALIEAVLSDSEVIVVNPGTLVYYGDGLGIQVRADYNQTTADQPFVTINTEELDVRYRYGANANLVGERRELAEGGDNPVAINLLDAEIDRQSGLPKIAVHLNDAVLYDDTGHGNMASVVGTPTVYVVNPSFPDDTAAVFSDFDDATAYAGTFDDEIHVEEQSIADRALAHEMIADRTEDEEDEVEDDETPYAVVEIIDANGRSLDRGVVLARMRSAEDAAKFLYSLEDARGRVAAGHYSIDGPEAA